MCKLLVVGTVAIDSVETPFGKKEECFGGSASYFSYAASYFSPVRLVASVGKDFPAEYENILKERNINLDSLEKTDGKTFRWRGKYEYDLNSAQTLETQLNVLLEFNPVIKGVDAEYVFLANIDPKLQKNLLDQIDRKKVKLVACDTMNYWITNTRNELLEVLKPVDMLVLNDAEARQLSGESNLMKAAKKIRTFGPKIIVIKKGEHGSLLYYMDNFFAFPAYPLEEIFDPTGCGDSFAGGMMGYLAKTGDFGLENMKKAIAYGTVIASFTAENFSLDRLRKLDNEQIESRLKEFKLLTSF